MSFGGAAETLRIIYAVDVADHGTKKLLASERAVQKSLKQTTASFAQQDAQARRSAMSSTQSSTRKAAGFSRERTAAVGLSGALRTVGTQERVLTSLGPGAAAAQARLTAQHDRQTASLKRLTVAERAQATAMRAGTKARAAATAAAARATTSAATGTGASAANRAGKGAGSLATGAAGGAGARLGGPALAVGVGLGVAVAQTVKFDKAMRNVNSIAQLSEGRFKDLGKSVRGMAGDTAQAPETLAKGLYDLVSSGFDAKESMVILRKSAIAATAGLTDTETSTAAVAAVLNAYKLPAAKAGEVSDQLFRTVDRGVISFEQLAQNVGDVLPFASSLGIGLDQVGASISTMTKAGISAPETMTRIKSVMTAMLKPGEELSAAIKKTGASSAEALLKQKGFQGGLEALVATTDGSKSAIAGLFPNVRALGGALALTGKNAKGAQADLAAVKDSAGSAARAFAEQSKSISVQWQKLKANAAAAALSIGGKLVPSLAGALKGMNALARGKGGAGSALKDLVAGISGAAPGRKKETRTAQLARRAAGRDTATFRMARRAAGREDGVPLKPGKTQQAGAKIRAVLDSIAAQAKKLGPVLLGAGKQLIDAFKPAMPFLSNVLLPLLKGVGKGVIGSVVVAFKIAVPVIKFFAKALGFIGKAARPLRGVIEGIGTAVGFLLAGPILKLLGTLPKVGGVFRLLGVPMRFVIGVIGRVGGAFGRLPGFAGAAVGKVTGFVASLPGRLASLGARIAKGFVSIGRSIVSGIVSGIKAAPKAIIGAVTSIIPKPLRGLIAKAGGALGGIFRNGGRVRRYSSGGLVPIVASGGEMMVHNGAASMIGGPSDRDGTPMLAPAGAAILTGSGQAMMAGGASLNEAIAGQAPHFAKGGIVQTARAARRAGLSGGRLVTATAIAGPESSFNPRAVFIGPRDHSIGLWQINQLAHKGRFGTDAELKDPDRNARAMVALSGRGRNWRPWAGFTGGKYRAFMGRARAAVGSAGSGGGASRGRLENEIQGNMDKLDTLRNELGSLPRGKAGAARRRVLQDRIRKLVARNRTLRGKVRNLPEDAAGGRPAGPLGASRFRSGLIADAFSQGQQAGQEGLTRGDIRHEGSPILRAIREATATRSPATSGGARRAATGGARSSGRIAAGGGWGGSENIIRTAIKGLGSASFKRAANHPLSRKNPSSDHNMANKGAFAADLPPGDGIFNRLRQRLNIPARKGSWNVFANRPVKGFRSQLLWHAPDGSHTDHVHVGVRKMRRGGFVSTGSTGSTRGRGALSGGLTRALSMAGGSLEALDKTIGRSLQAKLDTLRAQLERRVRKGGPRKTIERLQSVISLIDFEIGRRIGRIQDVVAQRTASIDRSRGVVDRALRKRGVSADSVQGIAAMQALQGRETMVRQQNVTSLQSALRRAMGYRRGGTVRRFNSVGGGARRSRGRKPAGHANKAAVREITEQLQDAIAELDESIARQIELRRDAIRAAGQEKVNAAQFRLGWVQTEGAGLEARQRLSRTQDTAGGMRQRADWIQKGVIPELQATIQAQQTNAQMLASIGDLDGWRAAILEAQSAATDLANAQADAADLIRDSVRALGAQQVSAAEFALSWYQGTMSSLDAAQRLNRTQDTPDGMRHRAQWLEQGVIPALVQSMTAAQSNVALLHSIGDLEGWRAAVLDAQSAATDLANAQADAADLIREAGARVVQDRVDVATHGATMADLRLVRLELEQRRDGTFGSTGGAQARADFIRQQIIPALDAEIIALTAQQMEAQRQGNTDLVRQLTEGILGKTNEILQKNLDANEQTAENTDALKEFGGSVAYSYRGEPQLDVIGSRIGA